MTSQVRSRVEGSVWSFHCIGGSRRSHPRRGCELAGKQAVEIAFSEKKNERGETRCVTGLKNTDLLSGVSLYAAAEDAVTVRCESGRAP